MGWPRGWMEGFSPEIRERVGQVQAVIYSIYDVKERRVRKLILIIIITEMIKEIKHIPTLICCCHIHFIIAFTWHMTRKFSPTTFDINT